MTSGPKRCRTNSSSSSSSGTQQRTPPQEMEHKNSLANQNQENGVQEDYPIMTQKGQRRYGPPPDWNEEDLPRGCEVYVSKLPKDILEKDLVPIFESCGKLYDIRLMMETQDLNKGFGFVKYCYKEDADLAVAKLNNYEIRFNYKISVVKSVDNNRIFIGNIPKNFSENEVLRQMRNISSGVRKVILYASVVDRTRNRGYGFVEFETHQLAAVARQKYKTAPMVWNGHEIKVDWAEPELEVDDETMKKVRVLYVRNLDMTTTEQTLRDLFSSLGGNIEKVKKMKDYAFVHFTTREEAELAKQKLQGHLLDGCEIEICWSKPVANREEYQQKKAASKAMLSGSTIQAALPTAAAFAFNGYNGELLYGTRIRNAAGAQGYATTKPYHLQRPRSESSLVSLQHSPVAVLPNPYLNLTSLPYAAARSPLELGVPSSLYPAQERVASIEETVCSSAEIQYPFVHPSPSVPRMQYFQTPPMMNMIPQPNWQSPTYLSQQIPQANLIPYYIPQSGLVMDNQYGSAFPAYPQYIPGPMLSQVPGISGSNMSIDRT